MQSYDCQKILEKLSFYVIVIKWLKDKLHFKNGII